MNTDQDEGAAPWSEWTVRIGRNLAALRKEKKVSMQALADRTKELDCEIPKNTIANLESGRKSSISVAEVAMLAAALGVPPARLLFDVEGGDVEIVPGVVHMALAGVEWWAGTWAIGDLDSDLGPLPDHREHARLYARYQDLLEVITKVGREITAGRTDLDRVLDFHRDTLAELAKELLGLRERMANPPRLDAADEDLLREAVAFYGPYSVNTSIPSRPDEG